MAGMIWLVSGTTIAAAVPLVAILVADVLTPARLRPLGLITLLNTITGHSTFLTVCVIMPLTQPVLCLAGSHRPWLSGMLLRLGARAVLTSSPFVWWRWSAAGSLPKEPWVLVSNHESVADILTCLAVPGNPRLQLAKPWVFRLPFLGWAAKAGGMVPMAALAEGRLSAIPGICDLVIFPEGTRSDGTGLGRFRSGALQAAEDLHRPVVVAIQFHSGRVLGRGDPWIRPGLISTHLAVPEIPGEGTRAVRSAARLADPPRVPAWMMQFIIRWESAAQQGPLARWRALRSR